MSLIGIGQKFTYLPCMIDVVLEDVLLMYDAPRGKNLIGLHERGYDRIITRLIDRVCHREVYPPAERQVASLRDDASVLDRHYRDVLP